jgi:hypothetical protein
MRCEPRLLLTAFLTAAAIPGIVRGDSPEESPPLPPRLVPPALRPEPAEPPPPPPDLEEPLDPGRDGWGPYGVPSPTPGFSLGAEIDIVHPVLRSRLTNDIPIGTTGDVLTLPAARLSWTVAPDFDLAYRLPRSLGYLSLNYRFVIAEGSGADLLNGAPADLHSRLTEHGINLDYGSLALSFAPHWEFDWRVGARFADVFFDSTLKNDSEFQQSSNNFRGAGPHARLDLERHLGCLPGFSLYAQVEGAVLFGRISQKFREEIGDTFGDREQNSQQTVPTLLLQAGARWAPPWLPSTTWTLGYLYERWWYVGQLGEDSLNTGSQSASRGEVETQGIFLRGEIDF